MAQEKTLEEILADIRRELEEDRAFLQISLLDPDPDIRAAEEARVQNVLELSEMMEDIITHLLHEEPVSDEEVMEKAEEEERKFEDTLDEKKEEIEKACETYEAENEEEPAEERRKQGSYIEYGTHTVGRADHRDNIEGDWILNAQGEEEIEEEKRKKKKKKGKKDKKDKKVKKVKKKDKKSKKKK